MVLKCCVCKTYSPKMGAPLFNIPRDADNNLRKDWVDVLNAWNVDNIGTKSRVCYAHFTENSLQFLKYADNLSSPHLDPPVSKEPLNHEYIFVKIKPGDFLYEHNYTKKFLKKIKNCKQNSINLKKRRGRKRLTKPMSENICKFLLSSLVENGTETDRDDKGQTYETHFGNIEFDKPQMRISLGQMLSFPPNRNKEQEKNSTLQNSTNNLEAENAISTASNEGNIEPKISNDNSDTQFETMLISTPSVDSEESRVAIKLEKDFQENPGFDGNEISSDFEVGANFVGCETRLPENTEIPIMEMDEIQEKISDVDFLLKLLESETPSYSDIVTEAQKIAASVEIQSAENTKIVLSKEELVNTINVFQGPCNIIINMPSSNNCLSLNQPKENVIQPELVHIKQEIKDEVVDLDEKEEIDVISCEGSICDSSQEIQSTRDSEIFSNSISQQTYPRRGLTRRCKTPKIRDEKPRFYDFSREAVVVLDSTSIEKYEAKKFRREQLKEHLTKGRLVWAKLVSWYPGIIVTSEDMKIYLPMPDNFYWVLWLGDWRVSKIHINSIKPFGINLSNVIDYYSDRLGPSKAQLRNQIYRSTAKFLMQHFEGTFTPLRQPYGNWLKTNIQPLAEKLDAMVFYPYPKVIEDQLSKL